MRVITKKWIGIWCRLMVLRYRWLVLTLAWCAYIMSLFHRMAFVPLIPVLIDELNMTYTLSGFIMGVAFIPYAILQIPAGYAADKWPPRKLIFASLLALSIAVLFFTSIRNSTDALVTRILIGVVAAFCYIPAMKLLVEWFPENERGTAIGFYGTAAGGAPTLALITVPPLTVLFGWRLGLIITAIPTVLIAVLCFLLLRDSNENELSRKKMVGVKLSGEKFAEAALSSANLWLFVLVSFSAGLAFQGLASWIPEYLVKEFNFSVVEAGGMGAVNSVGFIVGAPIIGRLSDKSRRRKIIVIAGLLVSTLCLFSLSIVRNLILVSIMFLFIGFVQGATGITITTMASKLFPADIIGKAVGFINTAAMLTIATAPMITGYVLEHTGSFQWLFTILGLLQVAGVIVAVFIREKVNA